MSEHFHEITFDTGQTRLNIAEGPDNGPPLLLLHGASGWWRTWQPVWPVLAGRFHLFAPDLRGSGKSARTPGAYGVMDMAHDVASLLDARISEPLHVVGHSFGGHVGLALTGLHPAQMLTLTLEDIPLVLDEANRIAPRSAGPGFESLLEFLDGAPSLETIQTYIRRLDPQHAPDRRSARADCLSLLDPDVIRVYIEGTPFAGYDPHALIEALNIPSLLVEADPEAGTRIGEGVGARAGEVNPQLRRIMIDGAGHGVHTDAPETFTAHLLDLLLSPQG